MTVILQINDMTVHSKMYLHMREILKIVFVTTLKLKITIKLSFYVIQNV